MVVMKMTVQYLMYPTKLFDSLNSMFLCFLYYLKSKLIYTHSKKRLIESKLDKMTFSQGSISSKGRNTRYVMNLQRIFAAENRKTRECHRKKQLTKFFCKHKDIQIRRQDCNQRERHSRSFTSDSKPFPETDVEDNEATVQARFNKNPDVRKR